MPPPGQPDDTGAGPGRAQLSGKVFVVLVVGSALALAVAAVWAFGIRSTDEGPYRPLTGTEFEVAVASCTVGPTGRPTVAGTVRNTSGERRTLVVEVEVLDPADEIIDTPRATVLDLDDGADARWETGSPYEVGRSTRLTCRVSDVFAAPGG